MPVNESFSNLVKDITDEILAQVQQQVHGLVIDIVDKKIKESITPEVINRVITTQVNVSLDKYQPDLTVFDEKVQEVSNRLTTSLNDNATRLVNETVLARLAQISIDETARDCIGSYLSNGALKDILPSGSISGSVIDVTTLKLTGDNITGGIIANFASTGIDDKATQCQVTILDNGTVVENTLYTSHIEVKGGATIDGDLVIKGKIADSPAYKKLINDTSASVKTAIGSDMFDKYQDRVFEKLITDGIDLAKIKLNGQVVLDGQSLTSAVVDSQLQTVGMLRDLQTRGETLLSETLYTTKKRVGVNTMDPSTALSVWDEEVEVGIGKQQQNTARIATPRAHNLVLGTNNQDVITLTATGIAIIPQLQIGEMLFTSSPTPPSYDAKKGTVVFNENPSVGGPLGWVSLGAARWANFGIID